MLTVQGIVLYAMQPSRHPSGPDARRSGSITRLSYFGRSYILRSKTVLGGSTQDKCLLVYKYGTVDGADRVLIAFRHALQGS